MVSNQTLAEIALAHFLSTVCVPRFQNRRTHIVAAGRQRALEEGGGPMLEEVCSECLELLCHISCGVSSRCSAVVFIAYANST